MARERRILIPHGANKLLVELTGFSTVTVRHALRGYDGVTKEAREVIRKKALEIGGTYVR